MESLRESNSPAGWASRCDYWIAQTEPKSRRLRRQRETNPLLLAGHGLAIRVDQDSLLVRDGNTRYPAERREWRFFKGGLDVPPAIVIIDGSGYLSLDAIDWLMSQQMSLIRLRWDGRFSCTIGSAAQAACSEKVRWQEATRQDASARVTYSSALIAQKTQNTLHTLDRYVPASKIRDAAHANITRVADVLHSARRPKTLSELLGMEGAIAAEYFRAWSALELNWSKSKRSAIPEDWRKFTSRSALRRKHLNRRATHPVNAMLNYAYAVLAAKTQIRVISSGYDPRIGILHNDVQKAEGEYFGFVLDQIEPMRPIADRAVLELIASQTFTRADFSIQHDGICRINPELARRVAQVSASMSPLTRLAI